MFKSLSLLIIAVLAVNVRAADTVTSDVLDISVAGDQTRTLTPLGPMTPDISVAGLHTSVASDTPDVSIVGGWTTTAAAAAT
jgi:hypothetical protein